jgi:hypothetical protein
MVAMQKAVELKDEIIPRVLVAYLEAQNRMLNANTYEEIVDRHHSLLGVCVCPHPIRCTEMSRRCRVSAVCMLPLAYFCALAKCFVRYSGCRALESSEKS